MSTETIEKKTLVRRTDEQIAAELKRKLAALESKISSRQRRKDTQRKVLLGVGVLALKDPEVLARVKAALSEQDRQKLDGLI